MYIKTTSVIGAMVIFFASGFADSAQETTVLENANTQLSVKGLALTPEPTLTLAQHRSDHYGQQRGPQNRRGQGRGKSGMQRQRRGQGGQGQGVMQGTRTLVTNHGSLSRTVIEIPNGVRTISTTTDPSLVSVLQSHPREMDQHLSKGGQVRNWDPFFAEIAKQHHKIKMTFKNLANGIEIVSTSDDPEVVKLIRAHAYKVSEFVERGREAAHESTPIPKGYTPPRVDTK